MSKLAQSTSKYTIFAKFASNGVVEKPDVIGAVFGQTEGLLGADMDLRELQRTGRVGRIEVILKSENGKTKGAIEIPSSLDTSETALIAATLETIERIGPCDTKIAVEKVEDIRAVKRKYVVERAKEILKQIFEEGLPESQEIAEQIKEAVRSSEISSYKGLPSGPNLQTYESVILCEGRADVIKLLKNGIKNVVAIEGVSIPQSVIELSKEKTTTAFIDGDRGGDLILREMIQRGVDLDFVARAPRGKEVEDLTKKEIYKGLRDKVPTDQVKGDVAVKTEETAKKVKTVKINHILPEEFKKTLINLTGTRAAYLFDKDMNILGKIPIKEIFTAIREVKNTDTIIFDGSIDQKLINFAEKSNIKNVVAMKLDQKTEVPKTLKIFTQESLD